MEDQLRAGLSIAHRKIKRSAQDRERGPSRMHRRNSKDKEKKAGRVPPRPRKMSESEARILRGKVKEKKTTQAPA